MSDEPEVRPKSSVPVQPPVNTEKASSPTGEQKRDSLPESFNIPTMQAIFAGQPPAVSVPVGTEDPELNTIWNEREKLMKAGIAFYKSMSGQTGVIFNALKLHPDVLKQADKAGKLQEVAPPFDAVEKALKSNPEGHPIFGVDPNAELTPPQPPGPIPPQSGNGALVPPPPPAMLRTIQAERVKATIPGGPTSGMRPGAGRVLNSLMKPPI